jgi:phosphatidate cytidylyltransferase
MEMRNPQIYWILGSLLAIASLASLIVSWIKRGRPGNPPIDNLSARVRSWVILILVAGAALLAGRIAVLLLFAFVSFLALREFLTQTQVRRADRAALLLCFFVVLPVQYVLLGIGWYGLFSIWIPVCGFVVLAVAAALFTDTERFLERTTAIYWGLMACVYCISHVPALMALRIRGFENRTSLLMLFAVLIAQTSDIFQYVWGKLIGRHLLVPALSPSKTTEGLVGGIFSATLVGVLLRPITPFAPWQAGSMAFLIAVLGFLGGLVMSAIKRDRGIKDWSSLIAGHGGMLDRIDSLCFSAPVFFHLTRYWFTRK